ncbi:sugar transferase [Streptomyces caniscabiei]|uniref:sugar transferase n=1 Tax=Streptomyces caniscabiei TaxID=2746961 RepID=UPI0029A69EAA|nr:sugar transferase [Streptomyces caniscabiei]MDX2776114.1 sugar transferase [Streptomyces caniscabiei]
MSVFSSRSHWIDSTAKRIFDVCLVLIAAPFLVLLIGVLSLMIVLIDQSPPLFWQWRVGKNGIPFRFYKLNTMGWYRSALPSGGASDVRATPLGRVLRWLILDEVPQILINVIRGDMSLVGPRPLLKADIDLMRACLGQKAFTEWFTAYCSVRPGWTGRFGISSRRYKIHSKKYLLARKRHDIAYMRQASCWIDIKTICVHAVLPFIDRN